MLLAVVLVTLAGLVAAEFDPELHAKYLTMSESSFIEYFNAQGYSWKMAEYDNIREKYAPCVQFDKESFEKLPLPPHDLEGTGWRDNLDLRTDLPFCTTVKRIYDQGSCSSSWSFATATTASDRTCIQSGGLIVHLSAQDFECSKKQVCQGGDPVKAFEYWRDEGLVTQECKPYNVTELLENKCVTECVTTDLEYKYDKHYATNIYRLKNDSDLIKEELSLFGSIQASFILYDDFFNFKSGIYEHTHGEMEGHHSVRIIGYGVENGTDYWIVANSWGLHWGENGWFRIKAFQKEVNFENFLVTGSPFL